MQKPPERLYGKNAVRECLRAQRRHIHRLFLAKGIKPSPLLQEVIQRARKLKIPIQEIPRQKMDSWSASHQGMVLETGRFPTTTINDILKHAKKQGELPFILALDHLEDPHNVGALLRTAEIVGVHGVILPNRRAAGVTPAVVSASAGASEHLRVAIVPNLAQNLKALKKENIWIVGVEKDPAAQTYHQVDLNMPLTLALGSEGKGLTRLIRQNCDLLLQFPMRGRIESLNASVAGALALYEAWRARQFSI